MAGNRHKSSLKIEKEAFNTWPLALSPVSNGYLLNSTIQHFPDRAETAKPRNQRRG